MQTTEEQDYSGMEDFILLAALSESVAKANIIAYNLGIRGFWVTFEAKSQITNTTYA